MLCQFKKDICTPSGEVLYSKDQLINIDLEEATNHEEILSPDTYLYLGDKGKYVSISALKMAEPYDKDMLTELMEYVRQIEKARRFLLIDPSIRKVRAHAWPYNHGYYLFHGEDLNTHFFNALPLVYAKRILMYDFVKAAALDAGIPLFEICYDEKFNSYYHLSCIQAGRRKHVYLGDFLHESISYFQKYAWNDDLDEDMGPYTN